MLVLFEAIFACDINQIIGSVETDWTFDLIQIVARLFRLLNLSSAQGAVLCNLWQSLLHRK